MNHTKALTYFIGLVFVGLLLAALLLTGCAATPLQVPEAASIIVSRNAPAEDCRYVGEVRGSQGNFFTADFTSDENLIVGARNELRDAAYRIGANYVQIETESLSHNTADYSSGGAYSATLVGNGYRCESLEGNRVVHGTAAGEID